MVSEEQDINQGNAKSKSKKSPINIRDIGGVAFDTVDALRDAVTSIGQEMLHQIAPRAVSKPGIREPKDLPGEDTKSIQIEDKESRRKKSTVRDRSPKKATEDQQEGKYEAMPISFIKRDGFGESLSGKSIDYRKPEFDLNSGIKDIKKDRKSSISDSGYKGRINRRRKVIRRDKPGLIRSVVKRFFQLLFFPLKVVLKIFRRIINLILRILRSALSKLRKEKQVIEETIIEEKDIPQEKINVEEVGEEKEEILGPKYTDVEVEPIEDLELESEEELYNKEELEKLKQEGIIYDSDGRIRED